MSPTDLRDQIDYLKALAEDGGRAAPSKNGQVLFAAGLIYTVASVLAYLAWSGLVRVPSAQFHNLIWVVATLIFLAVVVWRVVSRPRCGPSALQKALSSLWQGVGAGILAMGVCLSLFGAHYQMAEGASGFMAPVVLVFYGVGWWVTAVITRIGWQKWISVAAFLSAVFTAALSGQPLQMLAYAIALTATATVPGLLLMRAERG